MHKRIQGTDFFMILKLQTYTNAMARHPGIFMSCIRERITLTNALSSPSEIYGCIRYSPEPIMLQDLPVIFLFFFGNAVRFCPNVLQGLAIVPQLCQGFGSNFQNQVPCARVILCELNEQSATLQARDKNSYLENEARSAFESWTSASSQRQWFFFQKRR